MALIRNSKFKIRLKGATLIESLTALAIITAVMGAVFSLYTKTIGNQKQTLKTRAKLIQNEFEQNLLSETDLPNEFLTVNTEIENYNNLNEIKLITLIINDKSGKPVLEKKYLKYVPNK